jgi:hypothetical protein
VGGIGSERSPHLGAASKCEHWRSIDLADLKRMGLLKPIVGDRIRAITWKNDHGGVDKPFTETEKGPQNLVRTSQGEDTASYCCGSTIGVGGDRGVVRRSRRAVVWPI